MTVETIAEQLRRPDLRMGADVGVATQAPAAGVADALFRGDCRAILPTLAADGAHLVVTSPPYNTGWPYADDGAGDRLPLGEYRALLAAALAGCYRALHPGGVLALNVPSTIRTPGERAWPLAAWAQLHLAETGWLLREPIAWMKSSKAGRPLATGTAVGGPANPYLRPCHELVILASKGDYRRSGRCRWPEDRYIEWLKDVWLLPPGRAGKGDPPSFPDELVRRLVLLYSEPEDVVLDPFAGAGTVGRVARSLGRCAWLIEREPTYWPRLQAVVEQGAATG